MTPRTCTTRLTLLTPVRCDGLQVRDVGRRERGIDDVAAVAAAIADDRLASA
jgi:hypothetical protein